MVPSDHELEPRQDLYEFVLRGRRAEKGMDLASLFVDTDAQPQVLRADEDGLAVARESPTEFLAELHIAPPGPGPC